jgi:hypothetical protein
MHGRAREREHDEQAAHPGYLGGRAGLLKGDGVPHSRDDPAVQQEKSNE